MFCVKVFGVKLKFGFPFFAFSAFLLIGKMRQLYLLTLIFSLFHEIGHIVAMLYFGVKVREIEFSAGGICIRRRDCFLDYKHDAVILISGPIVNFALAIVFYALGLYNPFVVNLGLFLINMLPLKYLDGGMIISVILFYYLSPYRAEKIINAIAYLFTVLLLLLLVFALIKNIVNTSFVFFVIVLSFFTAVSQLGLRYLF